MSINLNDDKFNGSKEVVIFNKGIAGIAENISLTISKKKPEDKENAPDYKITFTDANGGTCNSSFWYIVSETQFKSVDQQIETQGKVLKHIIHAIYGSDYSLPSFPNAKGMLDGCMKLIKEGLSTQKFRVFVNYGTIEYRKKYIQPRSWVPFMESMSVPAEETRLKVGQLDGMSAIEPDSFSSSPAASAESIVDGDDW